MRVLRVFVCDYMYVIECNAVKFYLVYEFVWSRITSLWLYFTQLLIDGFQNAS